MSVGLRHDDEVEVQIALRRKTQFCPCCASEQNNSRSIEVLSSPVVASSRHSTTSVASLLALHWLEMWPQYWEKRPSREPT
jgi:hypothetical protein